MLVATVVLAGWRIVKIEVDEKPDWCRYDVWDPHGDYHGTNNTRAGAAQYAQQIMNGDTLTFDSVQKRWVGARTGRL